MSQRNEIYKLTITSLLVIIAFSLLAIAIKLLIPSAEDRGQTIFTSSPDTASLRPKRVLETKSLIVGIWNSRKDYLPLEEYLRKELGNQVKVVIDGDENLSYKDAKNQIIRKQWDIVFTRSPMLSIVAKDNGYSFAGRMFAKSPTPYYQSVLFVRSDSKIRSLADLKSTTTIALGEFNSPHSFYMPVYDLYGLSLRVDMGHKGSEIIEMVRTGKADIGAGVFSYLKSNPNYREIHVSRDIPGSGVYLSPQLSESDRATIKQVLLDAPAEVQEKANYGKGEEADYANFIGITKRAEEVLSCANFARNPVNFFCPTDDSIKSNIPGGVIVGRVNGYTFAESDIIHMNLLGNNNKVYRVVLTRQLLNQVPNVPTLRELRDKTIRVIGVQPIPKGGTLEVKINQPNQLEVL